MYPRNYFVCSYKAIILCTGFSELINEKQAKEMGIQEFVMKPFVIGKHAKTIRKVLKPK